MAGMSIWLLAVLALLPPVAAAMLAGCRGSTANRLVAVQLATALTALMLAVMTFAFDQSSFIDLALVVALLGLPGTLLMALFLERWL